MGENLTLFKSEEFGEIRTLYIDGEVWFVGKDVCLLFGDTDHKRSLSRVDDEDTKMQNVVDSLGRKQKAKVINESGLYTLLFNFQPAKSTKNGGAQTGPHIIERIKRIKKFKRWVTSEVLPAIRKTGSYSLKQKNEWIETRMCGKEVRKELTDAINNFLIPLAIKQNHSKISMIYSHYTRLCYSLLKVEAGKRDFMTPKMLKLIDGMETILADTIVKEVLKETHYKDIYQLCKDKLIKFLELMPVPEQKYLATDELKLIMA